MNRLQFETSPYLRQHAENPVDWYPWGVEALTAAATSDKPILLSIGYSACHWCHVMAHESFGDPETAAFMNANFVCIKVDREERPDLDDLYMQATLVFTQGHGGWPMTVFLTPDGRPFHAGTYYPKDDRYGMPSFRRVMTAVLEAYRERRDQVEQIGDQIAESLQRSESAVGSDPDAALLEAALHRLLQDYDSLNGGLSRGAPKFPSPANLEFVLQMAVADASELSELTKEAVIHSLHQMANGGIQDQIGGGFHRYSVDERWLVPHFEKMLYDNAQLGRLYLHAWQATGDRFLLNVATRTFNYLLNEMAAPGGGYYSATDADSEGEEGRFFVWSYDELKTALPPDQFEAVIAYYNVTEAGNFEGANILHVPRSKAAVASELGIALGDLQTRIAAARSTLYAIREKRVHPGCDDKILTSWNGLLLTGLAEAARILESSSYRKAAIDLADFLLRELVKDGRVLRTHKDGMSKLNGYLEDYAALIEGLLAVYQLTFDPHYFECARTLTDQVVAHFLVPEGGFYDTADDSEALIARPRNLQDNAVPAGNNKMARVLLLMAAYTGEARYESAARGILRPLISALREYPAAFGEALIAADLLVRGIQAVAVIGDPAQQATQGLITALDREGTRTVYRPAVIRALGATEAGEDAVPPLLAQRKPIDGQPSAYVCREFVCLRPVTDPDALINQLRSTTVYSS